MGSPVTKYKITFKLIMQYHNSFTISTSIWLSYIEYFGEK